MMQAITLDEGLILYQFDPPEGEIEGLNFMAIVQDGEALLLDTGYRANMDAALPDLESRGASPVGAIISHYHPDHHGGLALLGDAEVWAHYSWRATADAWQEADTPGPVEPDRIVSAPVQLHFGRRSLEIHPLPGHTDDSLAVIIDGVWLYAADALLLTNDGGPLLPSVHSRPVSTHLKAMDWLGERVAMVFIPGHGGVLSDRPARERDLLNRKRYLEAIAKASGDISFEEATAGCAPPFQGRSWHEHNYR